MGHILCLQNGIIYAKAIAARMVAGIAHMGTSLASFAWQRRKAYNYFT
jgi:hypothetical protein